ncbi:MAG: hypothetical protein IPL39_16310 [Opitutaceae bacterium]|nr:hypothetical protein [Opitutaceae bacterium]
MAVDSAKPKLLARVQIGHEVVSITNGNDAPWNSPTVILNDAFNGAILEIAGVWTPGEKKELQLKEFRGRMNRQAFKPDFESVKEVIIDAKGFQLGIYK